MSIPRSINATCPDLAKTRSSYFPVIYERQRPSRVETVTLGMTGLLRLN